MTRSILTAVLRQGARMLALAMVFGITLASCPAAAAPAQPPEKGQTDARLGSLAAVAVTASVFLNSLTETERAWLREHPVIRVAQIPGWPPIEFIDERGSPAGMAADYLTLIEQRLGLKFERVPNLSWQEAFPRLKRGEIDMTPSAAETPERKVFWAFTKPYMTIPIAVVTRADVTYIADLRELADKPVAVVDDFAVVDWIARDFPAIQLIRVKSTQQGLAMLQRKEVFAFVDNMLVVGHYLAAQKITDIKIAGSTPYNNAQCMAVRKDWAILAGILDKVLDSVSPTERSVIYRRWLPLRYEYGFDYTRLWPVAAMLVVVLMGLGAWNWRLSVEIRQRKQAEAALRASEQEFRSLAEAMPQIVWITRPDGWNIYFNQQWVDYTGLTLEESYGHGWNKPFHPDDQQRASVAWQNATQNDATYSVECRLRRADGAYRWWLVRGVPLRDASGKILKWFGTCTDIDAIKQAEEGLRQKAEALRASNAELEQFNRAMVGRELSMIELKQEIDALCRRLGEPPRYEPKQLEADRASVSGAGPTPNLDYYAI